MSSTTTHIEGGAGRLALHHLAGELDNPTVLLVCHATGFHGRCYRAMAEILAPDVRTVALDFRAHGDSDAPAMGDFGWAGMSDDVRRVVDHLRADAATTIHGFGHSMGGAALLDHERRHPGTFASTLVFEPIVPPGGGLNADDSPIVRGAMGRTRRFPSHAAAMMRYSAGPPLGLFRADVLHDYVVHGFAEQPDGSVELKCAPEHEAETFRNAARDIALEQLSELAAPIAVGKSGDGGLPAQLADAIVANTPGARLVEFPSLTHFGPLQEPVVVAQTMRTLMQGS